MIPVQQIQTKFSSNINKTIYLFILTFVLLLNTKSLGQIYVDTFGITIVNIKTIINSNHFISTNNINSKAGAWDLLWGPDNQLWFSNNSKIQKYNTQTHQIKTLLNRTKGYVMGITAASDFINNPYVYAVVDTQGYYQFTQNHLVLFRYTYDPVGDVLFNEQFMLSWKHEGEHSGGRIMYGQDNKVYVTTSEYKSSQDILSYNSGKILRINPDGTVPTDNPKGDYTYSWGHRNPQGIVQLPNGNIISSEYGQSIDELNLIKPNKHYGWDYSLIQNSFDGFTPISPAATNYSLSYVFPMDAGVNPPSGVDYYNSSAIPEFNGVIEGVTFSAPWSAPQQGILAYGLNLNKDGVISKNRYLASKTDPTQSAYGRIRDVCTGPNGEVYFIGGDRSSTPSINVIYNPQYISTNNLDYSLNKYINIYPNPTKSNFTLEAKEPVTIKVYNVMGQIVFTSSENKTTNNIDMDNQPSGVYVVEAIGQENSSSYRLIKE